MDCGTVLRRLRVPCSKESSCSRLGGWLECILVTEIYLMTPVTSYPRFLYRSAHLQRFAIDCAEAIRYHNPLFNALELHPSRRRRIELSFELLHFLSCWSCRCTKDTTMYAWFAYSQTISRVECQKSRNRVSDVCATWNQSKSKRYQRGCRQRWSEQHITDRGPSKAFRR